MSIAYRIYNQHGIYFVTFTVHRWVDVFTRNLYVEILLESLRYCQQHKGLQIYGWVVMSNHVHLIVSSELNKLSDIIRDFKKYTASKIVQAIEGNKAESRKLWMLWLLKSEEGIMFWEEGYHGEEIYSSDFFEMKLNYIHLNPVRAGIVSAPEDYLYSSSCDYLGNRKGLLKLKMINI